MPGGGGGGLPTRRRSNTASAAAAAAAVAAAAADKNTSTTPSARSASTRSSAAATAAVNSTPATTTIASSRPKRRSRGLPVKRGTPTASKKDKEDDDNDDDNDDAAATAATATAESPAKPKSIKSPPPASTPISTTPAAAAAATRASASKKKRSQSEDFSSRNSPRLNRAAISATNKLTSSMILLAEDKKTGKVWHVTAIVNGQAIASAPPPTPPSWSSTRAGRTRHQTSTSNTNTNNTTNNPIPMGNDGNLFHCHVCHGFGDVVCCDGCPHVYHRKCITRMDPSRISLENDEDPWFCPNCFPIKTGKKRFDKTSSTSKRRVNHNHNQHQHQHRDNNKRRSDSTSSAPASITAYSNSRSHSHSHSNSNSNSHHLTKLKRTCCECDQTSTDLKSCQECRAYLHHPSCKRSSPSVPSSSSTTTTTTAAKGSNNKKIILCSNCRAELLLQMEEEEENGASEEIENEMDDDSNNNTEHDFETNENKKAKPIENESDSENDQEEEEEEDDAIMDDVANVENNGVVAIETPRSRKKKERSNSLVAKMEKRGADNNNYDDDDSKAYTDNKGDDDNEEEDISKYDNEDNEDDASMVGSNKSADATSNISTTPTPSEENKAQGTPTTAARRRTRSLSMEEDMDQFSSPDIGDGESSKQGDDEDDGDDDDVEDEDGSEAKSVDPMDISETTPSSAIKQSPSKKRRRPSLTQSSPSPSPSSETPSKKGSNSNKDKAIANAAANKTRKKKKKKKKQVLEKPVTPLREEKEPSVATSLSHYTIGNAFKATPAFYFFLAETRLKIERNLARKHRIFNRLPKGFERNELVAKEGAVWWTKIRPSELRRYMNMSMRDFEQRIIEWKEEKNIRDMLIEDSISTNNNTASAVVMMDTEEGEEFNPDDEVLTFRNHERLYLGTTVGSKPFKPETGISHNRVLLELLQDMRFHPVPMFVGKRTETEYGQMDFARITIPYFDVHGPISTSVGDECLGCTRGWTHFCNVLKRRVPSIEHRAKLQPPLSSLMATRVGLGLRPRNQGNMKEGETEEEGKNIALFAVREVAEATQSKNLPIVPWDSLSDPSSRADDIVQFIEEAVAMKVPEPPRPGFPVTSQSESSSKKPFRGALPLRGKKRTLDESSDDRDGVINKCGRCRTVIQTDTGCVQCRRAQLVINMSKRGGREGPAPPSTKSNKAEKGPKTLKVQTYMLGRVTMKEGSGEVQTDGDQAIANGVLRQRWTPFSVVPPHTLESPSPKFKRVKGHSDDEDSESEKEEAQPAVCMGKQPIIVKEASVLSKPKEDIVLENADDASTDGVPSLKSSRLSSKRLRSARIGALANADPLDDADRQKMAERYKEEADDLHKKCLSVACCGILLALMRRDPLLLFAAPVTAEGYSAIIKTPIYFGKIRTNVLAAKYSTLGAFVSDCRLLCTNALAYNPPGSIYWKTAKELYDVLAVMQKRVSNWMGAVKDAHAFAWRRAPRNRLGAKEGDEDPSDDFFVDDPFEELRKKWPEAVEMLETSDWLRKCISADFMRTKENETAYYGALAVRRAAVAAEASLAPYPDTGGVYNTASRRSHTEDEHLQRVIDDRIAEVTDPVQLKDLPTWREESAVRVMRRAQSRRLEGLIGSVNGCARCDGMRVDQELKMAMTAETVRWGRTRRKNNEVARVHSSRVSLSTGLASQNTREKLVKLRKESATQKDLRDRAKAAGQVAVRVRGSRVHGWGLFADQNFKKGDVVAEYIGEYVSLAVTEAREKMYQEQRIQDYQFRLDDTLVIDATMRGGHGRYINHNCSPNCVAKMIPGEAPNERLKRVIIMAQRDIKPREELTYDYQFPLELDLEARIPCNCHSEHCRGFMNWDLPEKGSNNRAFRSQKRGANMRDRIRRLGRPLKGDKDDDDEEE